MTRTTAPNTAIPHNGPVDLHLIATASAYDHTRVWLRITASGVGLDPDTLAAETRSCLPDAVQDALDLVCVHFLSRTTCSVPNGWTRTRERSSQLSLPPFDGHPGSEARTRRGMSRRGAAHGQEEAATSAAIPAIRKLVVR